ncbi:hypothetical protein [Kroppenstedtia sanguinis]|uniref:DUF2269 family protein n=1 Tax=Kroppenstedtia sanguinis TaxID=1380684 RepID=A0ABW4C9X2_9BACL
MAKLMLFFHVIGAVGMGFYLLLPFFLQKVFLQERSVLHAMYWTNFITQWVLVVQFFSGGYLYIRGEYPFHWMIGVAVIFTAIGGFGGMFGYHIRKYLNSPTPPEFKPWSRKVRLHGVLTTVSMFFIIFLMLFPHGI